jgi:hypothetical protein
MDVSGSDIIMFGGWTKTSGARFKHEGTEEQCDYFQIWSTDTMSWKKGKYLGQPPTTRFGHTSTAIGPHLLIFGGWEYTKAQCEIIVLRECTNRDAGQEMDGGDQQPQYIDEDGMPQMDPNQMGQMDGGYGEMEGEGQYDQYQ